MYLKLKELTYEQKCELKEIIDFKKIQKEPTPDNINGTLTKLMTRMKASNIMWQDFKRRRPAHMEDWFEDRGKHLYEWLFFRHVEKWILKSLLDTYGVGNPFEFFNGYKSIWQKGCPKICKNQYHYNMANIFKHGFFTRIVPVNQEGMKSSKQDRTIIINPAVERYVKFQTEKGAYEKEYTPIYKTPLDYLEFYFRNPHRFEKKFGRKMDHREDEKLQKLKEEYGK